MRQLRFLRLLVPALLVPFLFLLVVKIRPRPTPTVNSTEPSPSAGPRVEQFEFSDLFGGERRYSLRARVGSMNDAGTLNFEGIERLEVERTEADPLIVEADRGEVQGEPGRRRIRLEGGVQIRDEAEGIRVSLPTLVFDEEAGEARSEGQVEMEDDVSRGVASSVVYGLEGQPTVLSVVEIESSDGWTLTADSARLHDGTRDVELRGNVEIVRPRSRLAAKHVRVWRDPEGRLQRAVATGHVVGSEAEPAAPPVTIGAERVEVWWGDDGEVRQATLLGDARVAREAGILASDRIDIARRVDAGPGWDVTATGAARASTLSDGKPLSLHAESLEAFLDESGAVSNGTARGEVQFDGPDVRAEASRATFAATRVPAPVVLESDGSRKARMASGRTRVAAIRIFTHPDGSYLEAVDAVEATLLPEAASDRAAVARETFFRADEVIHFVAQRLVSRESGKLLTFTANVRAWQGDRNLSANRVDVDQGADRLHAEGNVNARIPRGERPAASETEYVHVASGRLDYDGKSRQAVFEEDVRARQADGWVECVRLVVDLREEGGGAERLRGFEAVRFEFRRRDDPEAAPVSGEGDRIEHVPDENLLVLYGDKSPAVVRRNSDEGGVSTGRVLRYRLDTGALDVESGERDRARIRSPGADP